jgi:hypothetical protein
VAQRQRKQRRRTQSLQNINQKLTGPAQTLGTALEGLLSSALSFGQAAAKSLAFNITGPNTVGTQTLISPDGRGGSMTTVQSQLVGNATNALLTDQSFVSDIKRAKTLGLSSELLGQFVQQGPSSLPVLEALINSGSGAIAQLNATNSAIDALGNQYGVQTASDKYAPEIHADLQQVIGLLKTNPSATGQHVGAVINKTASGGARTATARPSLGIASSTGGRRNF